MISLLINNLNFREYYYINSHHYLFAIQFIVITEVRMSLITIFVR